MNELSKHVLFDYLEDIEFEIVLGNNPKALEILEVLKEYVKGG